MTPLTPAAAPRNILLCTLGASWAVIPEILGWLAPSVLDLYAHHPHRAALDGLRQRHLLQAPHELWLCTTEGAQTQASLAHLHAWWRQLGAPMPLRIWTAAGTDQLGNQAECDHIRELTLRVCLLASEATHGGQLVLSLAGGRKTMSADLQHAGMVFGAHVCLHVVGPDPLPAALLSRSPEERANQPTLFARPLAPELAGAITPLIAATGQRNELLDIVLDGRCVNSASFAVPLATPTQPCAWPAPADSDTLDAELTRRQRQGSQLLGNFLAQVAQQEHHENWRSLYRLSPAHIAHLRNTPLDETPRAWLLRVRCVLSGSGRSCEALAPGVVVAGQPGEDRLGLRQGRIGAGVEQVGGVCQRRLDAVGCRYGGRVPHSPSYLCDCSNCYVGCRRPSSQLVVKVSKSRRTAA
jgi:adenosine deaminase